MEALKPKLTHKQLLRKEMGIVIKAIGIIFNNSISKVLLVVGAYIHSRFTVFQLLASEEGFSMMGKIIDVSIALFVFSILALILIKEIKRLHEKEDGQAEKIEDHAKEYREMLVKVTKVLSDVNEMHNKTTETVQKNNEILSKLSDAIIKFEVHIEEMKK